MRSLLLALLMTAPMTAHAELSRPTSGITATFGGGLGAGDRPFRPGIGWTASLGGFAGNYDDVFAIGRHWGFAARVRQDLQPQAAAPELRTAAMLDLSRGLDLIVIGVSFHVLGGPLFRTPLDGSPTVFDGGTVRVAGEFHYRFEATWSAFARLEAGLDIADALQPSLSFLVGVRVMAPLTDRPRR